MIQESNVHYNSFGLKEGIIHLETILGIPIVDYINLKESKTVLVAIRLNDIRKWRKNFYRIRRLSKQIGKRIRYIYFPCNQDKIFLRFIQDCFYPITILNIIIKQNKGDNILNIVVNDSVKDKVVITYQDRLILVKKFLKRHFNITNIQVKGRIENFEYFNLSDYDRYIAARAGEREKQ